MQSFVEQKQEGMFFRDEATLRALRSISGTERIVIYCGAGVTIDQTGVSWTELVGQVFGVALGAKPGKDAKLKSVEFLLGTIDDPRQMASIVAEAFRNRRVVENDFLRSALFQILYNKSTWSTGQILRNVARFAIHATLFGRSVTIITTNYDAYIEEEIELRYETISKARGFPSDRSPGLFRSRYELGKDPERIDLMIAEGGAGDIELIYLHGRIDPSGTSEGVLVLTESSFAHTRDNSLAVLKEHFGRSNDQSGSKAILIVGSGLNDGPLIDALALTHERNPPPGSEPQVRLALTDLPFSDDDLRKGFSSKIETEINSDHVRQGLALRGRHLGLELLWPASHSQTAQFLEEMRVDLSGRMRHGRKDAYSAQDLGISYAARLKRWETQFATSKTMVDQGFVHDHLSLMNDAIKDELKKHQYSPSSETLRLELWARVKPSTRRLMLVGNSTGPLVDRDALRQEEVDCLSNASILAFREGRPLLCSAEELHPDLHSNRWQTFFSVPIFVHVESAKENGGGRVPVGVITLASTRSVTREIKGNWSVFRDLDPTVFEKIRSELLIPAGKGLLGPERSATLWTEYEETRRLTLIADARAIERTTNADLGH